MKSGMMKMSMRERSSCGTSASLDRKLFVKSLVCWREKYILVERPMRRRLDVSLDMLADDEDVKGRWMIALIHTRFNQVSDNETGYLFGQVS